MGAQLVKEAAIKTNDIVGDGTTTATVIAQAIIREGMLAIGAGGNPVLVKRGVDLAVGKLVRAPAERRAPGHHRGRLRAGRGDLGQRRRRGRRGARARRCSPSATAASSPSRSPTEHGMSVDFVEGFEYDNGYVSPYLVTHPASLEAILDDPYILLCAEKITKVQELMPLLDKVMRDPRPLVLIAENVEGAALSMLVHNHVNGIFQCVATRAPGFGDRRLRKLEDIATITGGKVHQQALRLQLETMQARAARPGPAGAGRPPTAPRSSTAPGRAEQIEFRLGQLRAELERATFGIDEDVLNERIGALSGKVGGDPGRARPPTPS